MSDDVKSLIKLRPARIIKTIYAINIPTQRKACIAAPPQGRTGLFDDRLGFDNQNRWPFGQIGVQASDRTGLRIAQAVQ